MQELVHEWGPAGEGEAGSWSAGPAPWLKGKFALLALCRNIVKTGIGRSYANFNFLRNSQTVPKQQHQFSLTNVPICQNPQHLSFLLKQLQWV